MAFEIKNPKDLKEGDIVMLPGFNENEVIIDSIKIITEDGVLILFNTSLDYTPEYEETIVVLQCHPKLLCIKNTVRS